MRAHLRRAKEINDQGVSALAFHSREAKETVEIKREIHRSLVLLLWSDNSEIIKKKKERKKKKKKKKEKGTRPSLWRCFIRARQKETKRRKSLPPSWPFHFYKETRRRLVSQGLFPLLFLSRFGPFCTIYVTRFLFIEERRHVRFK